MTRKEILAMPAGPEMDRLVAEKVMGWYVSPAGRVDRDREPGAFFVGDVCEYLPAFSTSIEDAWQVFEKLPEPEEADLGILRSDVKADLRWHVVLYAGYDGTTYVASAETAPLAICRAALVTASAGG